MTDQLQGKKIAILVANEGVEEIELTPRAMRCARPAPRSSCSAPRTTRSRPSTTSTRATLSRPTGLWERPTPISTTA